MGKKLTQEEFVQRVAERYGDLFQVLGIYQNSKTKILIECKQGHQFKSIPSHLMGKSATHGCRVCNGGGTKEDYEENPKFCLECNKKIEFADGFYTTMKKKFCNQSCSAKYNSRKRIGTNYNTIKKTYYCPKCGKEIGQGEKYSRRRYCEECNPHIVDWGKNYLWRNYT